MDYHPYLLPFKHFLTVLLFQILFVLDNLIVLALISKSYFVHLEHIKPLRYVLFTGLLIKLGCWPFFQPFLEEDLFKVITGLYLLIISFMFFIFIKKTNFVLIISKKITPSLLFVSLVMLDIFLSMDSFAASLTVTFNHWIALSAHTFVIGLSIVFLPKILYILTKIPHFEETATFLLLLFSFKLLYSGYFEKSLTPSWQSRFDVLLSDEAVIIYIILFSLLLKLKEKIKKKSH